MNVMLENLMLLGIYGIEVVKFIIGTKLVLKEKEQKKWMYLVGAGIVGVYLVLAGGRSNSLIIYVLVIGTTYVSISGRHKDKLIKVLLLASLLLGIDETISGVTREFVSYCARFVDLRFTTIFLDSLWGLLIVMVIFILKKDKNIIEDTDLSKGKIFAVIILNGLVILLAMATLNYSRLFVVNNSFQIFATVLVSMAYLCMSLLCWLLVYLRGLNEQTRKALSIEKELNLYRRNYYKKLMEKEEETRKFRHDINNHFMYLTSLAYVNDIDGIRNYLRGLNTQVLKIQKSIFITGNHLFDVILNEKLQVLHGEIKILVTGKASGNVIVDEVDMCTIFANLIDNAVEAVEHVDKDEAYIFINFRTGHSFLKITVKNSMPRKISLGENGLPKTTKVNSGKHGIGLSNVKETVKKYEGKFKLLTDNREFSVEIILPLKKYTTDHGVI